VTQVITTDPEGKLDHESDRRGTYWLEAAGGSRKHLASIFNIIGEETCKKIDDPVKKAIEEDRFYGLSDHTVLITKDGLKYLLILLVQPLKLMEIK